MTSKMADLFFIMEMPYLLQICIMICIFEDSDLKRSNTSLKDLSKVLEDHGRHSMLSFLSSLPISVLRILDTEANKFYDRNHHLYDAALLTRCYTQHALRPFIDSEINHKRHFIKIPS